MSKKKGSPKISSVIVTSSDAAAKLIGEVRTVTVNTESHGSSALIITPRSASYFAHSKATRDKKHKARAAS